MDEFKEWLEKQGFRFQHNGLRYEHNLCDWIAYRKTNLEVVPCETNEGKGTQIIVNGFFTKIGEVTHRSAEVEVVGEQMGTWWTLKAYSLTPEEVMNGLPEIEESLISAWNALRGTRRRLPAATEGRREMQPERRNTAKAGIEKGGDVCTDQVTAI